MIDRQGTDLLRRHIAERSQDDAGIGRGARHIRFVHLDRLGETEVEYLDAVVERNHHVLRLEIAMHDATSVGGGNPSGDLKGICDRASRGQCSAFEAGAQRFAVHQFGDDERGAAVVSEFEDREDVWMRELGDAHRLALEPAERTRVHRELGGQDLYGDLAIEPRIACSIDCAHPARADRRDDLVVPEAGAGR